MKKFCFMKIYGLILLLCLMNESIFAVGLGKNAPSASDVLMEYHYWFEKPANHELPKFSLNKCLGKTIGEIKTLIAQQIGIAAQNFEIGIVKQDDSPRPMLRFMRLEDFFKVSSDYSSKLKMRFILEKLTDSAIKAIKLTRLQKALTFEYGLFQSMYPLEEAWMSEMDEEGLFNDES